MTWLRCSYPELDKRYILLAIFQTRCDAPYNEFVVKDTHMQGENVFKWKDTDDRIRLFWCDITTPVDVASLTNDRDRMFKKCRYPYKESNLIPIDTKHPGNLSEEHKRPLELVRAIYDKWKIVFPEDELLISNPVRKITPVERFNPAPASPKRITRKSSDNKSSDDEVVEVKSTTKKKQNSYKSTLPIIPPAEPKAKSRRSRKPKREP